MSADRSSSSDERFVAMLGAKPCQGQLDVMGHLLEPHREGLMNLAQPDNPSNSTRANGEPMTRLW